jgi:phosphohistidine phosphatase SixA
MNKIVIHLKRHLICVLTLVLILCSTRAFGVTTVLLVRHADRANDLLSLDGWVRAKNLAYVARKAGVTAIYASNYLRTQQTVQPLAELLGLEPTIYNAGSGEQSIVNDILSTHQGEVVLVAGHSNTVLQIASYLGANVNVQSISDFDNLYLVTCGDEETNIINLQYGEESTPDIESSSCGMTTLLLVRHEAEGGDTGERAAKLAHVAKKAGVTAIYTTDTSQTVEELADVLSITVDTQYDSAHLPELIEDVLNNHTGEVIVVSGVNSTLSEIVAGVGGTPPSFDEDEFDNLFVVTLYDETPTAEVLNLQYGAMSPPENISVVQVIDRTGSMGTYGYMEPAKTAAMNFITLMEIGDEIGVVSFDDNGCDGTGEKAESLFPLTGITSDTVRTEAIDSIDPLDARGCTSIGAGMQMAQDDFLASAEADYPHAMVLLTDGFENTSPWVNEILPTIPDETAIYTVALGPTADTDLMLEIATDTGGLFYESPDTGDLISIYYQILGELELGEMAALVIGEKGSGNDKHNVTIDSGADEVTFAVGWLEKRGALTLKVKDPNGNETTAPGTGSNCRFMKIKKPLPGDWEVSILRNDSGYFLVNYTFAAFVKGASKIFSKNIPDTIFAGDKSKRLEVALYDYHSHQLISNARVKAIITSPKTFKYTLYYNYVNPTHTNWNPVSVLSPNPKNKNLAGLNTAGDKPPAWVSTLREYDRKNIQKKGGSIFQDDTNEVTLFDDGTHGDKHEGDGIYTNHIENTKVAGSYNIRFNFEGVTTSGSKFKRSALSTATVKPGKAEPAKTLVKINPMVMGARKGSEGIITIVPVDRFGNIWGPGLASKISISTTAGELSGEIIDNGDGFYFQKIRSTSVEKTGRVTVTIDGVVMETKPMVIFKKLRSVGIHAGLTVPVGNTNNQYDPNCFFGLGVGYHFTSKFSLVGLLGYNCFASGFSAVGDTYWVNISANLRYESLTSPFRPYINFGPGIYIPKRGSKEPGLNFGLGLDYLLSSGWAIELGGDYYHVFTSGNDRVFLVIHAGLVYRF